MPSIPTRYRASSPRQEALPRSGEALSERAIFEQPPAAAQDGFDEDLGSRRGIRRADSVGAAVKGGYSLPDSETSRLAPQIRRDQVQHRGSGTEPRGAAAARTDYFEPQTKKRAQARGNFGSPAEYQNYIKGQRAKELGVGTTAADYQRYLQEKRAKDLGVGTTAADYHRHVREKRAEKLGIGTKPADYLRYLKAKKAKDLGVGTTPADYERYRRDLLLRHIAAPPKNVFGPGGTQTLSAACQVWVHAQHQAGHSRYAVTQKLKRSASIGSVRACQLVNAVWPVK
jgi:hypothetical protein